MRSLIAGAGRFGVQVAQALSAAGHDVVLVEADDDRAAELADRLPVTVLPGDACETAVLEEAGALRTDVLVAATGEDEDNLVISLLAKRQFAVPPGRGPDQRPGQRVALRQAVGG